MLFFHRWATTESYTLSLHDALPISRIEALDDGFRTQGELGDFLRVRAARVLDAVDIVRVHVLVVARRVVRSEEHTSELQSHSDLVCRLLLEKKKKLRRNDESRLIAW